MATAGSAATIETVTSGGCAVQIGNQIFQAQTGMSSLIV